MSSKSQQHVRILMVEDVAAEAEIALTYLRSNGMLCSAERVETEKELIAALRNFKPDIILSDFSLPQFDGLAALRISRQHAPDVPFVFLSGTIGEEIAVNALQSGALDYVLKDNLVRLVPAVARALRDAAAKIERRAQEAQIARLNRVLRMLSGINGLLVRVRDRIELLQEACRLAVSVGGYSAAIAATRITSAGSISPVAWSSNNPALSDNLRKYLADSTGRDTSVIAQVIRTGEAFVCNNTANLEATATLNALLVHAGMLSVAVLPLTVDRTTIGVLTLVAPESGVIETEELRMLREVAGNLSFAIQYMQKDTTVRFLSHFDAQTGLAKRSLFCERVARLLSDNTARNARHAVIVLDVEHLSVINDSFGRRTGDLLVQHIADRLKRIFPNTQQIAHFGGGTFALVRDQEERTEAQMLEVARAQERAVTGEAFEIEQSRIPVVIRTGFAVSPADGTDAETLVQNAEAALRQARLTGVRHLHFNAAARQEVVGQLALEHKLHAALEREEFELYYQPKVSVLTLRIQGVEALIRWRLPDGQLVSPAAFLPLLEATGRIVDVGDWVIRRAARDCQRWRAAGLPPVRVAVNVAPAQLQRPDFVSKFLQEVKDWTTDAWGLDIEITEGMLHDDSVAEVKKLMALRETGVKIAIDDFGTGYSSLSRISSLPIDILKIDRAFVTQSQTSASGKSLVKTIVALAKSFHMSTVAEGVEEVGQLDSLGQMGCDQSQGYLHSPPVTADELARLLRNGKGKLILPPMPEAESIPA